MQRMTDERISEGEQGIPQEPAQELMLGSIQLTQLLFDQWESLMSNIHVM